MPAGDKDAWKPYVAQVGTCYCAHIEDATFRKLLSHIGRHFADYAQTELLCRSGWNIPDYVPVYQDTYKEIYDKHKDQLRRMQMPTAEIDETFNKQHIGDIFECAVARM